jgi:hypothetical protein
MRDNPKRAYHSDLQVSRHLLGPSQIISPRLDAGGSFNKPLKTRPEANQLEWIVQPAGGDTEVAIVWRNMMNAVMTAWQDNVKRLKQHNRTRKSEVGV